MDIDKNELADEVNSNSEPSPDVRILQEEIRRLKRENARVEGCRELIRKAVAEVFQRPQDLILPAAPQKVGKGELIEPILHISDVQFGKVTKSYDSAVATQRLHDYVRTCVKIVNERREFSKIPDCTLYLGGDIVEGEVIFPHQVWEIDSPVIDQTRNCARTLASIILYLLGHFKKVKIRTVPGNHGRSGSKHGSQSPKSNWDNVVYDWTYDMLMGPDEMPHKDVRKRCDFKVADDWYCVDKVQGWGNLIYHGDQVRGGFAGFPWYGVGRKAYGWIDAIPESWTYMFLGHFHTYAGPVRFNERWMLANGTTESDNTFAQANMAASGGPVQRMCFFHEEYGLISDHPIYLAARKRR